jgi:hypothetical protein
MWRHLHRFYDIETKILNNMHDINYRMKRKTTDTLLPWSRSSHGGLFYTHLQWWFYKKLKLPSCYCSCELVSPDGRLAVCGWTEVKTAWGRGLLGQEGFSRTWCCLAKLSPEGLSLVNVWWLLLFCASVHPSIHSVNSYHNRPVLYVSEARVSDRNGVAQVPIPQSQPSRAVQIPLQSCRQGWSASSSTEHTHISCTRIISPGCTHSTPAVAVHWFHYPFLLHWTFTLFTWTLNSVFLFCFSNGLLQFREWPAMGEWIDLCHQHQHGIGCMFLLFLFIE